MSELIAYSNQMLPAIVSQMQQVLQAADDSRPDLFNGMIHYHMGWADNDLNQVEINAGKRIRPLFCLLCCQAAGGNWQQALPAAAAIEILHNFTLVHDDIQDVSPTRRGRATLWTLWGVNQAINAGDAMFAQAHLAMSRLLERGVAPSLVVEAICRLDETCLLLTRGQHADMQFEGRQTVTVEEYLAMIEGKTAVLISLCAELGAKIAGSSPQTVQHYATSALNLGLAFQVRDDILGIWGDEAAIGKSAATDIKTRKKSLPILYGLEKSEPLRQLYAHPTPPDNFVQQAIALLDKAEARQFAESLEQQYTQTALQALQAANPSGTALNELYAMLLGRQA